METELVVEGMAFERAGILHRLHQPTSPPPHRTIILIHGRAGTEDVMWVFARALPANCLVVAPRAIYTDGEGFSWTPYVPEHFPTFAELEDGAKKVAEMIQALPAIYGANAQEVYLMGFSQGAALALCLAMRNRRLVQGVACLMGFVPAQTSFAHLSELLDLPIFMAVGKQDETIPYAISTKGANELRWAGADLTYCEYEIGHKMPAQALRDLRQWFNDYAQ